MRTNEKQAVVVFRRVRDFLKEKSPEAAYGKVDGVLARLDDVIEQLESHAREQDSRTRMRIAATRRKQLQASKLRRELIRPVVRGARTLFKADSEIPAGLQMPRARDYIGTIAAAEAMAQAVGPYEELFVEGGLPADFVQRITAAAAELRKEMDQQGAESGRRSASTAGLRREYARGREVVRMLDAMVAPRLEPTPTLLAEWLTISRFARRPVPVPPDEEVTAPVAA